MNKYLLTLVIALSLSSVAWAQMCNIYVHGYTSRTDNYFSKLPRQVVWDSSLEVSKSAPIVAEGILKEIENCPEDFPVVLRPHSYGAAQVFYILGQGRRFQNLMPEHPFVKIYKKTSMVVSYTGAYHGTPIMDVVCSSQTTEKIAGLADKPCVPTLLSSSQLDVSSYVTTPGIPTYVMYSTDHRGFLGIPGLLIGKFGSSFEDFFKKNKFNQNDNTLPISATMACGTNDPIFDPKGKCKKLDGNYFIDVFHETRYNHLGFIKKEGYMTRTVEDFLHDFGATAKE